MEVESSSFWSDIKKYEETLAKDPQSYCFALLSELYRKLGLLDDALAVAQKGCGLHPDYAGGFMALGRAYFEKGMKAESRAALENVIKVTPDNLLALKLLSQIYADAGETASAEQALRTILSLNPGDLESQVLLESLMRGGHARSAAAPAAHVPSADVFSFEDESGEDELILEDLEIIEDVPEELTGEGPSHAAEEIPVSPLPPVMEPIEPGAGTHAAESGEFSFAEEELPVSPLPGQVESPREEEESVTTGGKDPLATVTLAELYVSQGVLDRARAIYQELLDASPGNDDVRQRLASLQLVIDSEESDLPREEPGKWEVEEVVEEKRAAETRLFLPAEGEDGPVRPADDVVATLETWLENIRRRRQ